MVPSRFDLLARLLAQTPSRRTTLVALLALLWSRFLPAPDAAARPGVCRPFGSRCFPERGLPCCRGTCRAGRCRCPKGQRRCGNRCLPRSKHCRRRARPRRGCPPGKKRCQRRCIRRNACCGGCPGGQVCRNGGFCHVTTAAALQVALADGGPDLIRLCPRTTYRGTFRIERPLTVIGAGAGSSVLDGAGSGPVVIVGNLESEPVILQGLGIINGVSPGEGGGILHVRGPLQLIRSRVANNTGTEGGGIATTDALTLIDTVVAGNRATGIFGGGGGIYARASGTSVTLRGSSLVEDNEATASNGEGGGIQINEAGTIVTMHDASRVRHNRAPRGGGIHSASGSIELHDDSRVEANTAQNEGGGISLVGGGGLTLHDRAAITGNTALGGEDAGGGIYTSELPPLGPSVTLPDEAMVRGNTPDQCQFPVSTPTGLCT